MTLPLDLIKVIISYCNAYDDINNLIISLDLTEELSNGNHWSLIFNESFDIYIDKVIHVDYTVKNYQYYLIHFCHIKKAYASALDRLKLSYKVLSNTLYGHYGPYYPTIDLKDNHTECRIYSEQFTSINSYNLFRVFDTNFPYNRIMEISYVNLDIYIEHSGQFILKLIRYSPNESIIAERNASIKDILTILSLWYSTNPR